MNFVINISWTIVNSYNYDVSNIFVCETNDFSCVLY